MPHDFSEIRHSSNSRAVVPQAMAAAGPYELAFKRALDIVVVLLAAPFILPLVGVLAFLISRDGGPAFYSQDRVGRGGRLYRLWKLRTMVPDADALLQDYLRNDPEAAREWALTQKLKKDPRITGIGACLRKCSLDELPQLWNVLMGDMSLVGPRPMLPEQQEMYPGRAYYLQRPGITGSWQVTDRNQSTFADRARFDTDYAAKLTFATDIRILLATVRVVVRGTGY